MLPSVYQFTIVRSGADWVLTVRAVDLSPLHPCVFLPRDAAAAAAAAIISPSFYSNEIIFLVPLFALIPLSFLATHMWIKWKAPPCVKRDEYISRTAQSYRSSNATHFSFSTRRYYCDQWKEGHPGSTLGRHVAWWAVATNQHFSPFFFLLCPSRRPFIRLTRPP